MDDQNNEPAVEEVEEETTEAELEEVTDWEAEAKKARGIAQRLRTKLLKATEKKIEVPKKEEVNKNELDNADYALLTAKGYEEDEDIEFIQDKMIKWNKSLREILKDEDVLTKLKGMKIERDVKRAMPGSTKRTGSGVLDNLEYWKAKYDQTGELPEDFELRSAVINSKVERTNANKPSWR